MTAIARLSPAFESSSTTRRAIYLLIGLVAANLLAWAWAFIEFGANPVLMGTALLAYSFGLRHAVDADHIAAIDNVTRKLRQDGQRPVAVGLFVSLGHSGVVVLLSVVVALLARDAHTLIQSAGVAGGDQRLGADADLSHIPIGN